MALRSLALALLLATCVHAQPARGIADALQPSDDGGAVAAEVVAEPEAVDPIATRSGLIHVGERVAGRHHVFGVVQLVGLTVVEHVPHRRLRLAVELLARSGTFASATPKDAPLTVSSVEGIGTNRLRAQVTVDAAGAPDDVLAWLALKVDVGAPGRALVKNAVAGLMVCLYVGHDPIDIGLEVIREDRWHWMVAGGQETDYEAWQAGRLRPDAIRSANCYQFVRYALAGAGVPEAVRPTPTWAVKLPDGRTVENPTIEEAALLRRGFARGSPEVDQASKERGLRDYLRRFSAHYRLARPDHLSRRGDVVIFYLRDGAGFLQASHIALLTGEGDTMIHNAGSGPSVADSDSLWTSVRWDGRTVFEYIGPVPLEPR